MIAIALFNSYKEKSRQMRLLIPWAQPQVYRIEIRAMKTELSTIRSIGELLIKSSEVINLFLQQCNDTDLPQIRRT